MKTPTTILATLILAVSAMNCSAQDCDSETVTAVGAAMIVGGQSTGVVPQQISDNGRNAFVVGDGKGSGVIFQDHGTTAIWKMGDTTFIVPSGNSPAQRRQRERNY
jgi:hypothetical protein